MDNVAVYHLIEGARRAKGLTVIIDVFRAFSLECYLYAMGAKSVRPVKTVEDAFRLRDMLSHSLIAGERGGHRCEGFDFGNSPSQLKAEMINGKDVIHTTSAGTQGIANAVDADEIVTGSLVNAPAVAAYIKRRHPAAVSLVCMGKGGKEPAKEDELCAEYIKSLLDGHPMPDIRERAADLRYDGGSHFFDAENQDDFPMADFDLCTDYGRFDFVLRVRRGEIGYITEKIDM